MTMLAVCCWLFHGSIIRSLDFFPYLRITAAAFQTFALHLNVGLFWPHFAPIFVYWHSLIPESIHLEKMVKEFILFSQQHRDQKTSFWPAVLWERLRLASGVWTIRKGMSWPAIRADTRLFCDLWKTSYLHTLPIKLGQIYTPSWWCTLGSWTVCWVEAPAMSAIWLSSQSAFDLTRYFLIDQEVRSTFPCGIAAGHSEAFLIYLLLRWSEKKFPCDQQF